MNVVLTDSVILEKTRHSSDRMRQNRRLKLMMAPTAVQNNWTHCARKADLVYPAEDTSEQVPTNYQATELSF